MSEFVHLHVHSTHSLLAAICRIPDLARRAADLGMGALALTDLGTLSGAVDFREECRRRGVRPLIGCEFWVTDGDHCARAKNERRHRLVLLAKNRTGYEHLVEMVSESHLNGFHFRPRIDRDLIAECRDGLVCLSGGVEGEIPRMLSEGRAEKAEAAAKWHRDVFGEDFFLEVAAHPPLAHPGDGEQRRWFERQTKANEGIFELGRKLGIPVVATNDVFMVEREDWGAQEVLQAIGIGKKWSDANRIRCTGSEYHSG